MSSFPELVKMIGGVESVWSGLFIFLMYYTFKNNFDSIRELKSDNDEATEFLKEQLAHERSRSDERERRSIERGEQIVHEMRSLSLSMERLNINQERIANELDKLRKDVENIKKNSKEDK